MRKEESIIDFVDAEKSILAFWEKEKCFEKLVDQNKEGDRFVFLDGPITANNPMGIHHAWGRTLKDMYIKYNSMLGRSCQFQNGFDSQGLWVEVEVEKEIGIKVKGDIVKYGLAKFTEKCINRVKKYSSIITEQSKRLGQWMDWEHSYFTNTDLNITSIWHFLKKCHQKGWITKSQSPMPWCPRCGTSLSEHEMSGSYSDMEHLSIYAKLPIKGTNDKIVCWTTTPWTLTANVALAINPDIEYVRLRVKSDSCTLIVGKNAIGKFKGDILSVSDAFKGESLLGLEYETCFPDFVSQNFVHKIVSWNEVDATEGVGVVHIAPGCGAEDYRLGKQLELVTICPINDEGIIIDGFGEFSSKKTTEVSELIANALEKVGKLYKTELYTHSYPKCWRCKTPVVFKLVDEWYIQTDEIRPLMIEAAKTVNWEPEFAGKRMLDWLSNMGDWNISRKRFYGLPLPFYPCKKCGHLTIVGSKAELLEKSGKQNLDNVPHLHRPYIDKIKICCENCGSRVERIPEVGDCWLDAGIAPFSTKKYFEDEEYFKKNFPSELVIEMKEQIRLWFYSILFMSVTLEGVSPYKNVVAHSSVINEEGGKFSKTGYMINLDEVAEKIGADPVRYLYAAAPIGGDVRFGYKLIEEARRKMLGFWNIYVFFNIYASIDNPDIASFEPDFTSLRHSDKWLLARTDDFISCAKNSYASYKSATLTKDFECYIDDVSNWYVRINRKRFWKSSDKIDQLNAYWCLYRAIKVTLGIMAPIIPFMTDYIWQNTVREIEKDEAISVHLSYFPKILDLVIDQTVLHETKMVREIITTSQRMRNESQIKIKQPLRSLFIETKPENHEAIFKLIHIIKDELNIKNVEITDDDSKFNDVHYSVNFRVAGITLKGDVQILKTLVDNLTESETQAFDVMYDAGSISIGRFKDLSPSLFERRLKPKTGFIVTTENGHTFALNTILDDELLSDGLVRELIRQIQILRKDAGFAVEQRIIAEIITPCAFAFNAINKYIERIKQDILASSITHIPSPEIEKTYVIQDYQITAKLLRQ
ncbi:MAG: isoleucine--tRNA ligase [Christensenellaceae bacterium]|nr:isoleucine--tRNA ligase [Christensenellaceae bacterium]